MGRSKSDEILGSGLRFPLSIGGRGGFRMVHGADAVAQSIGLILATRPGERLMRPEFGCAIHDFVFAPDNANTRGAIAHHVHEALSRWEPRIDVREVRVQSDPEHRELLLVDITYRIRATGASRSIVYPFFLQD